MELDEFANKMRQYGANVERNANLLKRKAALAIDTAVVLATPVDTGRARANWQVALGAPITSVREAYVPGKGGASGSANAQAAIAQGKTAIGAAQPGQAIHITNNLPYIGRLNDGSSAQAPAGFVEKAATIGHRIIQDGAKKIVTGDLK